MKTETETMFEVLSPTEWELLDQVLVKLRRASRELDGLASTHYVPRDQQELGHLREIVDGHIDGLIGLRKTLRMAATKVAELEAN